MKPSHGSVERESGVAREGQASPGVAPLRVAAWETFDWLWHGFSTRAGGVSRAYRMAYEREPTDGGAENGGELNLGYTASDTAENVLENRLRFAEAVTGSRETPLVGLRQVHSNLSRLVEPVSVADLDDLDDAAAEADGLLTGHSGLLLAIQTADCIPVLVVDRKRRAVAGFHAGWRGTVERVVELGVARMRAEFGSEPCDLSAAIGPGIGACCYTVGGEVEERFRANFAYAEALLLRGATLRLDLIEANRRQLLDTGIDPAAIHRVTGCTVCEPERFFSHRASGGRAGRMMAAIGIRQALPDHEVPRRLRTSVGILA